MMDKTAAFIMQELYENYRLWAVNSHTVHFCCDIFVILIMGTQVNVEEFLSLLIVIEDKDFSRVPTGWRNSS